MGWTVGDGGTVRETHDGGVTWNPQTSGVGQNLLSVSMATTQTGWVVGAVSGGAARIRKTTNGGTNWLAQTSNSAQQLNDVCAIDTQTAWAVGNVGTSSAVRSTGGQPGPPRPYL